MKVDENRKAVASEQTVNIALGGRYQVRKGCIPNICTLTGEPVAVSGVVLWIPRATYLPILEIRLPSTEEVMIGGRAGMLVNDTDGRVVVHWSAEL